MDIGVDAVVIDRGYKTMANQQTMQEHIERLEREIEQLHQEIRNMQNSHISELEALEHKLRAEQE